MPSGLRFDPEFAAAIKPVLGDDLRLKDFGGDVLRAREHVNDVFGTPFRMIPPIEGARRTATHRITSADGTEIDLLRFDPDEYSEKTEKQPCILYVYGGGMFAGGLDACGRIPEMVAKGAGRPFFFVCYRTAPENPYPKPMEDVHAALMYLSTHSGELGIDPARIGILGASAGALLAVSVALKARDEGLSPPIAKLILYAPLVDDRTAVNWPDDHPMNPFMSWTPALTRMSWDFYLGKGHENREQEPYAVPGRVDDLSGLPSTWIETSGTDLFCGEAVAFAHRMMKGLVEVELRVLPGLPHAFAMYAPMISSATASAASQGKALLSF